MSVNFRPMLRGAVVLSLAVAMSQPGMAQRAPGSKEGAAVIVDGIVREVFQSPRQNRVDYLVQVDVQKSELGRSATDSRRIQAPAPGDQVYVHVYETGQATRGLAGSSVRSVVPSERSRIRAYLYPRAQGGWEGASPEWFEPIGDIAQERSPNDPEPPIVSNTPQSGAPAPSAPPAVADGSILQKLGLRAEQLPVSGRLVLKVIDVAPGS